MAANEHVDAGGKGTLADLAQRSRLRCEVVTHADPPTKRIDDLHGRQPRIAELVVVALRREHRGELFEPVEHARRGHVAACRMRSTPRSAVAVSGPSSSRLRSSAGRWVSAIRAIFISAPPVRPQRRSLVSCSRAESTTVRPPATAACAQGLSVPICVQEEGRSKRRPQAGALPSARTRRHKEAIVPGKGSQRRDAAIVGIYEYPLRKVEGITALQIKAECARAALDDAGLSWQDVDAVYDCGEGGESGSGLAISEYLGLSPRVIDTTSVGGSSYEFQAAHALRDIAAGKCRVALLTYGSTARADARAIGTGGRVSR